MTVTHSNRADTSAAMNSSQPNSTSHSTLNTVCSTVEPVPVGTTVRPNGHNTKPASLNACTPNGMPTMVTQHTRPARA